MKKKLAFAALSVALASCSGGEPEIADPYVGLADGTLLVRFEANAEIAEGQCNPNVHYALRTAEAPILINANFEVVDQNLNGSGFAIFDEEQTGIARNTVEFNMFDPYPMACSELTVRVQDLTCRTEDGDDAQTCPSPVFEGTDMFAEFRGLPNY